MSLTPNWDIETSMEFETALRRNNLWLEDFICPNRFVITGLFNVEANIEALSNEFSYIRKDWKPYVSMPSVPLMRLNSD